MHMTTRLLACVSTATMVAGLPVHAAVLARIQAESAPAAVTVYPDQAAVTRTASVPVPAGDSVVVLAGVPAGLVADSVNARGKAVGMVTIGSVETRQVTFDRTAVAERGKAIEARLRAMNERIAAVDVTLAALASERDLVDRLSAAAAEGRPAGPQVPPEAGFRLADNPGLWKAARTAVHDGVAEIGEAARLARTAKDDLAREKAAAEAELRSVAGPPAKGLLEIAVSVSAETATTLELSVTYQVRGAQWHPVYEARLDSGTGKLALREEAAVAQRTGEDWGDVAVTLSTARPAAGVQAAALQSWRVALFDPALAPRPSQPLMSAPAAPSPARSLRQNESPSADAAGSAMPAPAPPPAPVEAERASAAMVATGLAVEYVIPGRASIPADGTERRVRIADMAADAAISARTVPRVDQRAYLQARFTSPSAAPMLPGPVALYLDGTFVGRSQSGLVRPGEQVSLPFGGDDRIRVAYEVQDQKRSTEGWGITGSKKVSQSSVSLTTIRSLHSKPIEVTVLDQVPVSGDAELVVTTAAEPQPTARDVEDRPGVLAWTATYAPNEERKLRFGWTVSAPEGKTVTGMQR